MGQFSNQFFSESDSCHASVESRISFLIDNYEKLIHIYHVIDDKMKEVEEDKQKAVIELEKIRVTEKINRIKLERGQKLTEAEIREVEEKKKYYKDLIRKSQPISNGKKLETDHCTMFVINNFWWFKNVVSGADMKARKPVAAIFGKVSSLIVKPFKYMIFNAIVDCKDEEVQNGLIKAWRFLDRIPKNIKEHIMI